MGVRVSGCGCGWGAGHSYSYSYSGGVGVGVGVGVGKMRVGGCVGGCISVPVPVRMSIRRRRRERRFLEFMFVAIHRSGWCWSRLRQWARARTISWRLGQRRARGSINARTQTRSRHAAPASMWDRSRRRIHRVHSAHRMRRAGRVGECDIQRSDRTGGTGRVRMMTRGCAEGVAAAAWWVPVGTVLPTETEWAGWGVA